MCYAIPGKVVEIKENKVTVEYFGEHKYAINELQGLKVGNYIYAQGGFVINRIPEKEALPVLEAWKEMFFQLKEVDNRITRAQTSRENIDPAFLRIIDKAAEEKPLKKEGYLRLLNSKETDELKLLYRTANFLRQKHLTNSCCVHGIIEFSNYCKQDCEYCGIRKSNDKLPRYRMSDEEIIESVEHAVNKLGFKALVLQSGEDPAYTVDRLYNLVKEIKKRFAVLLFVSVGEIGKGGYAKLWEAGARAVLLRFESSTPEIYTNCHPNQHLKTRLDEIKNCLNQGYLIATGALIGLPGQTAEDTFQDILVTKSLKTEMYSFGPFLPAPNTPLQDSRPPDLHRILKTLAVARIIDPEAKILVTTALETLDKKNGRKMGLLAGANSLMLNVTPVKYRKLYSIYPERAGDEALIEKQIEETLELLYSLGRAPTDLGVS